MAQLKNMVLGSPHGTIFNLVFRKRDDKFFIYTRPANFTTPTDPASVTRRERFKISYLVAKALTSIPAIKNAWTFLGGKNVPVIRQLFKMNYAAVNPSGLPVNLHLTPKDPFALTVNDLTLSPTELQVDAAAIGTNSGITPAVETQMKMVGLVYLSNPTDPALDKYDFIKVQSAPQATVLDTGVIFSMPLSSQDGLKYSQYQNRKAFCALVTLDTSANVVHYSQTITE